MAELICVVTPWLTQKLSQGCHCLLLLGLIQFMKHTLEQRDTTHRKLVLSDSHCCQSESAASHFGGLLFAPGKVHPCRQDIEEEEMMQRVCAWVFPRSGKVNRHFLNEGTKTVLAGVNPA